MAKLPSLFALIPPWLVEKSNKRPIYDAHWNHEQKNHLIPGLPVESYEPGNVTKWATWWSWSTHFPTEPPKRYRR